MPTYLATLNIGLVDVALPNGQIAQGGQVALLSDKELERLSSTAVSALFSDITVADPATVPVSTVTPFRPVYTDH